MRYENWDVLLFPEASKVPVQEFKIQCFVTKDSDSPYLQNPAIVGPASYYPVQGNFGQIPVLTAFVPSLPKDTPFRVSIHSWEKPRPSRLTESLMQPDDLLLFEARVFIDGLLVSGGIFGQRTTWPYVIDLSSHIDRDGNQDTLRFPPFHPEILDQRHWDAGDAYGRIKVVIAEGFARPLRSPPFERVKDVIALSFQHAPTQVLEYSNIAWPNPSMWANSPRSTFKYVNSSSNGFGEMKEPEDAHAHSPGKRMVANTSSQCGSGQAMVYNNAWVSNRAFPVPTSQWQPPPYPYEPRWGVGIYTPLVPDFAIESYRANEAASWQHRGARSSCEDVPMPDYNSSSSSRAISSVTGMSYEHSKQPSITAPMDDEQYNLLIQALTPTKAPTMGTRAPSNTPSAAGPIPKSAAAAEARPSSYARTSARTSALRELSQPSTRDISGSTNKSNPIEIAITPSKMKASPSGNIKSKKEGAKETPKENRAASREKEIMEVSAEKESSMVSASVL
ncbi:uncharacterized protein N7459_006150 [Penicillium hispanicum]|uniref:uncharacterized protein n=1 Tax=Penicillium hispanicum TaxID=1080232 RepID=UPI002540248E|nr:uncharacterized protein N7459_006150 [Penicillium hispanicum]KAJ5580165.1 hypothetical protein N7459_006150 [Penicillium hispanicum]